jgi:uncharacterized protein Yka (UPF0111/DUF47 family)
MSTSTEFAELKNTINRLRGCVNSLQSRYGDDPDVRRIANDVERLEIDADEIERHHAAEEVVRIPDTPYDANFWRGAADEGLGGGHHLPNK